jgi:hypothetical protein
MEPDGSLPLSQEPSIRLYPEPDRSNPYHPILSLEDPFSYCPPTYVLVHELNLIKCEQSDNPPSRLSTIKSSNYAEITHCLLLSTAMIHSTCTKRKEQKLEAIRSVQNMWNRK